MSYIYDNPNPLDKMVGDCVVRAISLCEGLSWEEVTFNGNIAIPTGGAITPIAVAIAVNGEARPTSKAIYTPTVVDAYGNVTSTAIVTVPKGCCFSMSIRYVDATVDDATTTPTPTIEVQNANVVVNRIA